MKILLTGATGYLGRQICEQLRSKGYAFTALSRTPHNEPEFQQCNILETEGLEELCSGHDVLIHSAGLVSHSEADSHRVWKIHVEGTQNILAAAKAAGVRRVIYLSTSGTIGVHTKEEPIANEDSPSPFSLIKAWPYYRSKLFAEQIALDFNAPDFEVICLNPSLLLGPGDTAEGVSTKPVRMFLDDELPVAPSGGIAFVDVRDVAEIVVDSIQKGKPGARYLLNGANMTFLSFYQRIARIADKNPPLMQMPQFTRKALNWLPSWKKIGENVGLDLDRHDILLASHFWYVDDAKARAELDWNPRDPLRTLEDTVHELRERENSFSPWA